MLLDTNIVIHACRPGGEWLAPWTESPEAAIASVTKIEALGFASIRPEEGLAIQDRFSAEPVYRRTGKGQLKPAGVAELRAPTIWDIPHP